jgi:hypothetical protein
MGREDFLPRLASAIPEWAAEEEVALKSMSFIPEFALGIPEIIGGRIKRVKK